MAEDVKAHPLLGKVLKKKDVRKYLPSTRTDEEATWDQTKSVDEIANLKKEGQFVDLMQWRAHRSNIVGMADDGYVLEYRLFDKGKKMFDSNNDKAKHQPKYMYDATKVGVKSVTEKTLREPGQPYALVREENVVPFDPKAAWKAGDLIPEYTVKRKGTEGSAADNNATKGVWKDTVCVNPFYDESAALADLILPDTTYLERWDWEDHVSPSQVAEYYLRQPVVKPLGEARNFADVCCDLAKRMDFPLGFKSMQDFVKKSCRLTKASGGFSRLKKRGVRHDPKAKPKYYSYKLEVGAKALAADGVILDEATGVYWNWKKAGLESLEEARTKGYADTKGAYKAYVGQKFGGNVTVGFKPDAVNKSGYFELYSDILKKENLAPLPTFAAVPEHAELKPDELILTTYKVNVQIHSRSANCKWLSGIYHENPAWINPATAEKLGIREGAKVVATSAVGELEVEVRIIPAVVPGVLAISHHCGHWEYGRYASGKRSAAGSVDDRHDDLKWWTKGGAHPNWIIPNSPDPVAGQQRWMDTVVKVSPRPTA